MIQKSSIEGKLPGFTAQNLFTYTSKASSSLKNHYSGLSTSITPASDCFTRCYDSECAGLEGKQKCTVSEVAESRADKQRWLMFREECN